MSQTDTYKIFIRDCDVQLYVGVHAFEKDKTQTIRINLELEAKLSAHYDDIHEKSLARVLDYDGLYSYLTKTLPSLGHIYLLEAIADHIITFSFEDPRIQAARVRVEKPEIYQHAAGTGVELTRYRKDIA